MSDTLGEFILKRFTPAAARQMAEAIAGAHGREVFFAGALRGDGLVDAVRVCARGNVSAVTAVFEGLDVRDVVIHNHPGGVLEPSDADLELAHAYSAHGHGVYIVDNEATRVYVVVEPFLPSQAEQLDVNELAAAFSPGGPLAKTLERFEVRPQQRRMMEAVVEAFNRDGIRTIEAPTGVGKTLAYLIPAVQWALRNKERIVISTRTINLQEQIVHKDIPLLQGIVDQVFTACLVKGRGNYLCPRKLERALGEATLFDDAREKAELDAVAEWAARTEDGSLSDMPQQPGRELWERVCSEADTCNIGRCPDPRRCFVGRARRAAARADVLVVNHHMLFSDLAIKREQGDFTALAVLPAFHRVILDEGHSVEDSATEYFGANANRFAALALLGRFIRMERGRERGLIPTLRQHLMQSDHVSVNEYEKLRALIDTQFAPDISVCRDRIGTAFDALRLLASAKASQIGREIKWRLTPPILADEDVRRVHEEAMLPAVGAIDDAVKVAMSLHTRARDLHKDAEEFPPMLAADLQELTAYATRLQRLGALLGEIVSPELPENAVRWIEIDTEKEGVVRIARCPLHVGQPMADWVYENLNTIVMTSATMAVKHSFEFLYDRLGLDRVPKGRAAALELDSPFDFEKQAMLGVVTDLPDPSLPIFGRESIAAMGEILKITRGHAFVLFTSFAALDAAHRALADDLRRAGVTPLRQGELARTQLLDRFRSEVSSVLFGTDSFWEGVDVAGDALQCVILPKLPFRVPTEPILEARAEALEAAGHNAFTEYSLPQAVIKFRQGFGRLIRRRSDRGVIVVLDRRIVTKFYGKHFLQSLPPLRTVRGPRAEVYDELRRFFAEDGAKPGGGQPKQRTR